MPDDEARSRSAVSRAYYCLFNAVVVEFERIGTRLPRDASGHMKAQHYFLNTNIPEAKQVGKALDDLRDERNDADYRLGNPGFTLAHAEAIVSKVDDALTKLAGIDKVALKTQVDHYRRTVDRTLPPQIQ